MAENLKKYSMLIVIVSVLILVYVSYKIAAPFLAPLLAAGVVAVAAFPLYEKLNKKIKQPIITSLILIFLILILIVIPLIYFANQLFQETVTLYNSASSLELTQFSDNLQKITGLNINFERHIREVIKVLAEKFVLNSADLVEQIMQGVLQLFIFFFSLFFFLKDGKEISRNLKKVVPLKQDVEDKLFLEIKRVIKTIISVLFIIAVLEGVIAFIGFYLFGIPNPVLWSFLIALSVYLPILSPPLIYVPAAIYLGLIGKTTEGIFLLIYFLVIITSYLDNIVKFQIMKKNSNINPIVVLIGTLGGLSLFGIAGIVVGPLVLSILFAVYRLYQEENAA
nr:hypothetical protein [Nanoarchaeum sp.]